MIDIKAMISLLERVREDMIEREASFSPELGRIHPEYRESATNLLHYLTLRTYDLRELQNDLSALGLSSVGHSERYTLRNVTNILCLLYLLLGSSRDELPSKGLMLSMHKPRGRQKLYEHTLRLFGPEKRDGHTRIMVTLPTEAATSPDFIRELLEEANLPVL